MKFNTANMTFRQLRANGLSYRVPQFQSDYSWDVDHWDDLWPDIVGLFGDEPEPVHYMGCLVLQSADGRSFDIIDGQQRMTTPSLLMLASVSQWRASLTRRWTSCGGMLTSSPGRCRGRLHERRGRGTKSKESAER